MSDPDDKSAESAHQTNESNSSKPLPGEAGYVTQGGNEDQPPEWVLEAEDLYLSKKLSSYAAVASHFKVARSTVGHWAKLRDWQDRKRQIDNEAARQLKEQINKTATQAQVDTFSTINQNAITSGLRASHYINRYTAQVLKEQEEAIQQNRVYTPPSFPAQMLQLLQVALELQPKEEQTSTALDQLAGLLNPRED